MDLSRRLAELAMLRTHATTQAAALRALARSVAAGSRRARELSQATRAGIVACKELWDDLRQMPPPERRLPVCRVCGTVRTPARRWTAVPAVVLRQLESHPGVIPLAPGVCPHCFDPHAADPAEQPNG